MFGVRKSWQRNYLIRPNVEAVAATYTGGFSALSATAAMMGWAAPMLSVVSSVAFGGMALKYTSEALYHFKYMNGLWRNTPFFVDTQEMPGDDRMLWMGRGFKWTKEHTQRLYDIMDAESATKQFTKPPKAYYTARQLERIAKKLKLTPIAEALRRDWFLNPYPNLPVEEEDPNNPGGLSYIHGLEPNEGDFYIPYAALNSHTLVLGASRVGKTRAAEVMVTQDIRHHKDSSVIMIDPKGDQELALRMYMEAKRAGKADKFYFFHLAFPELSCRYNGIAEFNRITEVATRVTSGLDSSGNSKVFKDFAWLFLNTCQKAVFKMGKIATYQNVQSYLGDGELLANDYVESLNDDEFNSVIEFTADNIDVSKLPPSDRSKSKRTLAIRAIIQEPPEELRERIESDEVLQSVAKVLQYDRSYYDKITASAMPHLSKLTTGQVSELISPDYSDPNDPRIMMDLRKIIREGGIVYVGLDAQTDNAVASAVGNSYLSEILSIAGEIYNHGVDQGVVTLEGQKPRTKGFVRLHVDESNEVFGDEFNPILNKAGGSGIMVTAYTQVLSDIEVRLGDKAKAEQALGNFGTTIIFRVRGEATAKYFVDQMPQVKVMTVTPSSKVMDGMGTNADGQFKSSNGDTIAFEPQPLIPINAFLELPKGQAFVYSGSKWYKVKMPLFQKEPDMPENIREMMRDLEETVGYRVTKDVVRAAA